MFDKYHHLLDHVTLKAYVAWITGFSGSGWLYYLVSDRGLQKFVLIFSVIGLFLGVIAGVLKVINEFNKFREGLNNDD